ncbi:MAG TPA: TetR/AcrR family transcriptional regulator [Acidimicrobiales bacterium]|jgi:AcrR family transcriptional regulator
MAQAAIPASERRDRTRRAALTPDEIVAAAIVLADRDGLDELSMRRLAAELGVGAMTLYGQFRTKEDLLRAMADAVLVDAAPSPSPDAAWVDTARDVAVRLRATLLDHPGVAPLVARCGPIGPNALRATEAALAWLRGVGFDEHETPRVFQSLLTYVLGAVALEAPYLSSPALREQKADAMRLVYESLPASVFPNTMAMADHLFILDPEAQFTYGLELLLTGLQQRHTDVGS